jgi:hypothetical protein
MASSDELVEQWFAQTLESYPHLASPFLASEKDPFRNPAGNALRNGMAVLLQELLGNMNTANITPALDQIIRLRAVQDFTPGEAVGFVFLVRSILRGTDPPRPAMVEAHIDQLALMAFDHYMQCREQIAEVRAKEAGRSMRVRPALYRK